MRLERLLYTSENRTKHLVQNRSQLNARDPVKVRSIPQSATTYRQGVGMPQTIQPATTLQPITTPQTSLPSPNPQVFSQKSPLSQVVTAIKEQSEVFKVPVRVLATNKHPNSTLLINDVKKLPESNQTYNTNQINQTDPTININQTIKVHKTNPPRVKPISEESVNFVVNKRLASPPKLRPLRPASHIKRPDVLGDTQQPNTRLQNIIVLVARQAGVLVTKQTVPLIHTRDTKFRPFRSLFTLFTTILTSRATVTATVLLVGAGMGATATAVLNQKGSLRSLRLPLVSGYVSEVVPNSDPTVPVSGLPSAAQSSATKQSQSVNNSTSADLAAGGTIAKSSLQFSPKTMSVESAGITVKIESLGENKQGGLEPLSSYDLTGWYEKSSLPGDPGAVLISGFVTGPDSRPAALSQIKKLSIGAVITLSVGAVRSISYEVVKVQDYEKSQLTLPGLTMPIDTLKNGLNIAAFGAPPSSSAKEAGEVTVVYAVQK